ncbi:MAG: outer membrane protein assembly factor BamD [Deltaproteobacteria bacterium]|nr:MAG: outer membrane protein assembly factor BamD [Deltaproteobacteria bacterium]
MQTDQIERIDALSDALLVLEKDLAAEKERLRKLQTQLLAGAIESPPSLTPTEATPPATAQEREGAPAGAGRRAERLKDRVPPAGAQPLPPVERRGNASVLEMPGIYVAYTPKEEAPAGGTGEGAAGRGASTPLTGDAADRLYDTALAAFRGGDFGLAVFKFLDFLQKCPQHPRQGDAHFYLAESYFALQEYPQAIVEYDHLTRAFPDHAHVADALYKEALCHLELGDAVKAAEAFDRLIREFPGAQAAQLARERIGGHSGIPEGPDPHGEL